MKIISIVCDILIVLISSFAILQYLLNKRDKIKSAATIVYTQLKSFDKYIDEAKSKFDENGNMTDYHLSLINSILETNTWSLNKHISIKKLSQDDIENIDKTFSTMESLEDSRKRIMDTFMTTNNAKSFALQFQSINMLTTDSSLSNIEELSNRFNKLGVNFSSKIPHDIFKSMIENYNSLSGTTTIEKLRKLSYKTK